MGWLQLTIGSDASHIEEIGELLEEFGAVSISYVPQTEEPVFADDPTTATYWERTAVMALLDEDIDLDILLMCIRNRIGTENIHHHRIRPLKDRAWSESHKAGHEPEVFADKLCICPSWCRPPDNISYVLRLDPGLAFGSGTHATTGLCLEWLAGVPLEDKQVIDYGCGSGILGLAALKLGAARVVAVDIDEQALRATRENAVNNNLADRIYVRTPADMETGTVDILMANILLNPLLQLAPRFHELVRPDGYVVLSGILANQAEECLERYLPWFNMKAPSFRDEWVMLCGRRKADADSPGLNR